MNKLAILLLASCIVFFSCTQENTEQYLQNPVFHLQPQTEALDFALLSDPFFATLFNSKVHSSFESFYYQSWQKVLDSELFVVAESSLLSQIQLGGQKLQAVSSLSAWDHFKINKARRLLVSPLFPYFNPELMSKITTERGNSELNIFSYALANNRKNRVYIDNSYALRELALTVADYFQQQADLNRLIIFADSSNAEKNIVDLELFIRTLNRFLINVEIIVYWDERKLGLESVTQQSLLNISNENALVVLHLGAQTYSILNYIYNEFGDRWKDKIIVIHNYWKDSDIENKVATLVHAMIGASPEDIFTEKDYIYSRFYRYK